jgi:D-alanyl-lipoteichoic acid acyltransferase DltB (MBOAT superfamily)
MLTFMISGLWHGANATFIVWGAVHGALYVVSARLGAVGDRSARLIGATATRALQWIGTFAAINLTWIFFRAQNLGDALEILGRILDPSQWTSGNVVAALFASGDMRFCMCLIGLLMLVEWSQRDKEHPLAIANLRRPLRWLAYFAALFSISLVGASHEARFIYFKF